jgi:ketosteroid isomerase-like protein
MPTTNVKPDLSIQTTEPPTAQRLRDAFAAFDRGDLDHLRAAMTDDCSWTNAGTSPIAGTYRGWDEIVGMLGKNVELSNGTFKTTLISVLANDTQAAAIYDATATVGAKTETHRFFLVDTYAADGRVKSTNVAAFDQAAADALINA